MTTLQERSKSTGKGRRPRGAERSPSPPPPALGGPSRQLRQERGVETREKLIAAAIDLLSQEGYASFSTTGVAKMAGVSRGALQYHFDSREAMMVAVRTRLAGEMHEKIAPTELASLGIQDRVATMIDYYWGVFGSPRYVAALEIRIFERFNEALHAQIVYELGLITELRDQGWLEVFADSPISRKALIAVRRFTLDVMRGLAIRQLESDGKVPVEPELALLRRLVGLEIAGAAQPEGGMAPPIVP